MANTIINKQVFSSILQGYLRTSNPAIALCNTRFEAQLRPGQQIHVGYPSTVRVQDYNYSTDVTVDPTVFTDETLTIQTPKVVTINYDPLQNMLTATPEWEDMVAEEAAYQLSRNLNQYVSDTGVDAAVSTVAGGALTAGTTFNHLTTVRTTLSRNRAGDGLRFGLVEPGFIELLTLANIANGFNRSDEMLVNAYKGDANGFRIYECNDLPCTQSLTLGLQPTAGDTFTLYGQTWEFVATGTAAAAGEISLGADLTATKVNVLLAINGTGTPGASTYIDFSVDVRRQLLQTQLNASAFSGNVTTLTGFGRIGGEGVFASGSNVFGQEVCSQLFGVMNAIDLVVQENPMIQVNKEPRNASYNILVFGQWGAKVFYRNTFRLVKSTFYV